MTRNRQSFSIFFGLFLATGCNLDLDDLLDPPGDESGESGETGDDEGDDGGEADDGAADDGAADGNDGAADGAADGNDGGADGGDGADTSGADGADDTSGGDSGELPTDVLGAWITGDESAAMLLELHDDGTFAQGLYYEYDDAGCWTVGNEAYSGTFVIDASTLVLAADAGAQELDQCGTVSDTQDIAETVQLAYTLGVDEQGDALSLDDGTGTLVFHRVDDGA